jgi:hypothetical protein
MAGDQRQKSRNLVGDSFGVSHGVLDRAMPKPILDGAGVMPGERRRNMPYHGGGENCHSVLYSSRTFPEEPCILLGIRDETAVSPSEALPSLRRMIRARQAR